MFNLKITWFYWFRTIEPSTLIPEFPFYPFVEASRMTYNRRNYEMKLRREKKKRMKKDYNKIFIQVREWNNQKELFKRFG